MSENYPPSNNTTPNEASDLGPKNEQIPRDIERRAAEITYNALSNSYNGMSGEERYSAAGRFLLEEMRALVDKYNLGAVDDRPSVQGISDEALRSNLEEAESRGLLKILKGIGRVAIGGIQSAAARLKEKFSWQKNKDNTPEQKAAVNNEVDTEDKSPETIVAEYDKWFGIYTAARADYNRRGMLPFGNRRRERNLKEATEKLNAAEKRKIDLIVEKKRRMGFYGEAEGDETEALQAQSDDMFGIMLQMREERRQAALAAELRQMSPEDAKWYENVLIKMGDFMRKGGKIARALKAGGTGFALNLGVGIFKGLTGATLPVSLAVGGVVAAGSLTVRSAVMKSSMKEQLNALVGEDGKVLDERFSDAWIKKYINSMRHAGEDNIYETLSDHLESEVNRDDSERYEAARKAATRSALYFAAGSLLGGITGMVGSGMVRDALGAQVSPPASAPDGAPGGNTIGSQSGDGSPPVDTGGELPPSGEGVDLNGAKHPWDYAKQQVGAADAMSDLKARANEALARGHEVAWKTLKNGKEILIIDGKIDTQSIVNVLYGNK